MTGISVAVANKIFKQFSISFKKHEIAGYLACRGDQQIHATTLTQACQQVIQDWFVIREIPASLIKE